MRIIFAGTPEFARVALERLHHSDHTIALTLTQPDRPAGRGMKLQASPVKQFALDHGMALIQPRSLRLDGKYPADAQAARTAIEHAQADAMVVAAYGLILPQWLLDTMSGVGLGCLNIHASLLPRWRGAAPIHRAIEAGDTETGVTIMQMDAELDTGDMLMMHTVPITPTDTTGSLHDRLADLGGKLIVLALEVAAQGRLKPIRQPEEGISYASKVEKHEAVVNWHEDATTICRRIRAFNPFPGASATLGNEVIKVWAARAVDAAHPMALPGTVLSAEPAGIAVAARDSVVLLTELQRAGGKRLGASDFLRGFALHPNMRFDTPA
ncbi:MAG: methionyl-tRNA formyltransferase [Rhodoferax sp.]|nr:methionyl-tRNA formyltransferase [Rhodoferax sp.]